VAEHPPDATAGGGAPGAPAADPRRRAIALLALLTLVWGTNWGLFPVVLREVSVWHFRAVSTAGAGLLLLAVARLRGVPLAIPRRWWGTVALATSLYLVLWNIASAYAAVMIPSGQAAVLGFTMPLWAALFGWLFLRQRLDGRLLLALALGVAAVALLAWRSLGAYAQAPLGVALGLLSAIGWAVGTMILKHRQVQVPALVLTGWQLLITAVPIALGSLLWGHVPAGAAAGGPSWTVIALIVYITLVPMAVGNLAWFTIVGLLPTTVAGLSSIMVPVVAMVSGALMHGEPLGPVQWGAMACCALALWLAMTRRA
jgi:drug/metabolite transporter (DMT)-like permease